MKRITNAAEPSHRPRPPTVKDIALRVGLSQAAVSYALIGPSPRVSEAARQQVLSAADELGYQPNLLARGLRGKGTGLLGIIVRDGSAATAAEVCRALMRRAPAYGYDIVLTDAGNSAATLLRLANLMKSRLCDGLFLVGELPNQDVPWEAYERIGLPTVALLYGDEACPGVKVKCEQATGLSEAVQHLRGLGHSQIAYVGTELLQGLRQRTVTFTSVMREQGLPLPEELCVTTEFSWDGGARAVRRLMTLPSAPTAVVACTDHVATGILAEARRMGLDVPADLSVVGFDDNLEATLCYPALTTVRQPLGEMADISLKWFRDRREGREPDASALQVGTSLVVRQSTALARRQQPQRHKNDERKRK